MQRGIFQYRINTEQIQSSREHSYLHFSKILLEDYRENNTFINAQLTTTMIYLFISDESKRITATR